MNIGIISYLKMTILQHLKYGCLSGRIKKFCLNKRERTYLKAVKSLDQETNIIKIVKKLRWN